MEPDATLLRPFEPRCKADRYRLALISSDRPAEDVWLDARALEMYLQTSRRRVCRLAESGTLPCRRVGRQMLVSKADADALMRCDGRRRDRNARNPVRTTP